MKLKDFDCIALNSYFVFVNENGKTIDVTEEKEKYMNCTIKSIHVLDEDTMCVNINFLS